MTYCRAAGDREILTIVTGSRQATGYRLQATGFRERATGYRGQATGRLQATGDGHIFRDEPRVDGVGGQTQRSASAWGVDRASLGLLFRGA